MDHFAYNIATALEARYIRGQGGRVVAFNAEYDALPKIEHASATPWEGVNALDAVVAAYMNIAMLRQQVRPREKTHGVVGACWGSS